MISHIDSAGTSTVTFRLPAPVHATSVAVCGEFNDWVATAHPMTRQDDGSYLAVIVLPCGRRWRFRYLLDGQRWENDSAANDYEPNQFGWDSVVDLTTPRPVEQ
jgi:1,4-alpha-glucan branching enzyme